MSRRKSGKSTAPPVNVKAEVGGAGDASLVNIKFHSQTATNYGVLFDYHGVLSPLKIGPSRGDRLHQAGARADQGERLHD